MIVGALIGAGLGLVIFSQQGWWLSAAVIGVALGHFLHMYLTKKSKDNE